MSDVSGAVSCEGYGVPEGGDAAARVAEAREALADAEATLIVLTVDAVRSGALSQVAAARVAGVDRHTVRRWLGLPRRRPARPAGSG